MINRLVLDYFWVTFGAILTVTYLLGIVTGLLVVVLR